VQPPNELLSKGKMLYGVQEDDPEEMKSEILSKGRSVFVPQEEDRQAESWGQYAGRVGSQVGTRVFETLAGGGTDFLRAAAAPGQFMEGVLSKVTPDTLKEHGIDFGSLSKSPSQYFLEHLGSVGLGTKEIREAIKERTGGALEPKGTFESILGGVAQDLPLLLLTRGTSLPKTIASSVVGNTTKEALKDFGFGETGQEVGKFATQTLTSLLNPRLVQDYFNQQYNAARNSLPRGQTVDMSRPIQYLQNYIGQIRNTIGTGKQTAQGNAAIARAEEIIQRAQANGNRLPLRDVWDFRSAINGEMNNYGGFYRRLQMPLRNTLRNYSQRYNRPFGEFLNNGDQAFMGYQNSRRLAKSIRDFTSLTPQTVVGHALLDTMLGRPAAIGTLGTSFATVKAYEMANRALTNPTIRNLYLRTIGEAGVRNSTAFLKDFKLLEKSIENYDKVLKKPKK
jgi:hypothetical protein